MFATAFYHLSRGISKSMHVRLPCPHPTKRGTWRLAGLLLFIFRCLSSPEKLPCSSSGKFVALFKTTRNKDPTHLLNPWQASELIDSPKLNTATSVLWNFAGDPPSQLSTSNIPLQALNFFYTENRQRNCCFNL